MGNYTLCSEQPVAAKTTYIIKVAKHIVDEQDPSHTQHSESFLTQPVARLLIVAFVFIALIPLGVLGVKLHQEAWNDAWREINEKHRLLAENLASPISIHIGDRQAILSMLAKWIADELSEGGDSAGQEILGAFSNTIQYMGGFSLITLIDPTGNTRLISLHEKYTSVDRAHEFADNAWFLHTRDTGAEILSGIERSVATGEPSLTITQPVVDKDGKLLAVLLAELQIDPIERLRSNIRFGIKGHSAIVDHRGRVIAHPNPDWMAEMRDLSHLSVVQEMMAGKTGVTEFYSPFVKQTMVAGYTSVPGIGWGIMVPQPKAEVEAQVLALLYTQLRWSLIGLALAIALAIPLARLITRPINQLADSVHRLRTNRFQGELPPSKSIMPREIKRLYGCLRELITGLQESRARFSELNNSLQTRVEESTAQLRDANSKLEMLAKIDHLTELANRRHFENTVNDKLKQQATSGTPLCVMLIDIDNFKEINDTYGHAAGDQVLVQIAPMLKVNMRRDDIVARYGGDEFVIQMACTQAVGLKRARELRSRLENWEFSWEDAVIHVTASIGLLYVGKSDTAGSEVININQLLEQADKAMYEAKRRGRNTVVNVAF